MDERRRTARSRTVVRRRRIAAIGGLALLLLAAVAIGLVWADQSAAGRQTATTTTSQEVDTTVPTGHYEQTMPAGDKEQTPSTTDGDSDAAPSTDTTKVTPPVKPATGTTQLASSAGSTVKVKVWFVKNEKLVSVTRTIPATKAVGAAALKQLLAGPSSADKDAGLFSEIPGGTKLLGLNIKDGVAIVDLSGKFASGGGTGSMYLRLGQLIYTITQFPTVDEVQLRIDGKTVTALGGEGLLIPKAISRTEWGKLIK